MFREATVMPKKLLTELIPDFKKALSEGLEAAADDVVEGLQEDGPHWTGQFAASWGIAIGQTTIPGVTPLQQQWLLKKREKPDKPYPPIFKRKAEGLEGYTIGNLTDYKLYAMDHLPISGDKRGDKGGATAKKDWFKLFALKEKGSRLQVIVDNALTSKFNTYKT